MDNSNVDVNAGVINWHDLVAGKTEDHTDSKIGEGFYNSLRRCGHLISQYSFWSFGMGLNVAAALARVQDKIKIEGQNTIEWYR